MDVRDRRGSPGPGRRQPGGCLRRGTLRGAPTSTGAGAGAAHRCAPRLVVSGQTERQRQLSMGEHADGVHGQRGCARPRRERPGRGNVREPSQRSRRRRIPPRSEPRLDPGIWRSPDGREQPRCDSERPLRRPGSFTGTPTWIRGPASTPSPAATSKATPSSPPSRSRRHGVRSGLQQVRSRLCGRAGEQGSGDDRLGPVCAAAALAYGATRPTDDIDTFDRLLDDRSQRRGRRSPLRSRTRGGDSTRVGTQPRT